MEMFDWDWLEFMEMSGAAADQSEALDSVDSRDLIPTHNNFPSSQQYFSTSVKLRLNNLDLWKKLHELTNPMKVTKIGKKLFPELSVHVNITNMDAMLKYYLVLDLELLGNETYTYDWKFGWRLTRNRVRVSPAKKVYRKELCVPRSGCISRDVVFTELRVTNHPTNKATHMVLETGKFYQVKLSVEVADSQTCRQEVIFSESFPVTKFIATSECRNLEIVKLKVDNDPHSKGQRMKSRNKLRDQHLGRKKLGLISEELSGMCKQCQSYIPSDQHFLSNKFPQQSVSGGAHVYPPPYNGADFGYHANTELAAADPPQAAFYFSDSSAYQQYPNTLSYNQGGRYSVPPY